MDKASLKLWAKSIDGATRLHGIIGKNISYTLSPSLHNLACQKLGINAVYAPFDVATPDHLGGFLDMAWDLGFIGFNVTTPYKEVIARLLKCETVQSVNTIYRGPDGWLGASTDAAGLQAGLLRANQKLDEFEEIIILGSGGVVRAVLEHLSDPRAFPNLQRVVIARRNSQRDQALQEGLPATWSSCLTFVDFTSKAIQLAQAPRNEKSLIIQATNAPASGTTLEPLFPILDNFEGFFLDLCYGKTSDLYGRALAKNIEVQDGEPMLIEQARGSQVLWHGRAAPYEALRDVLKRS